MTSHAASLLEEFASDSSGVSECFGILSDAALLGGEGDGIGSGGGILFSSAWTCPAKRSRGKFRIDVESEFCGDLLIRVDVSGARPERRRSFRAMCSSDRRRNPILSIRPSSRYMSRAVMRRLVGLELGAPVSNRIPHRVYPGDQCAPVAVVRIRRNRGASKGVPLECCAAHRAGFVSL